MILYDQNYDFIGVSNETLSYLGYEDLSDFTSQHSDFANLLVQKEGYIYKFQNFSWIDFILYSGSPNKSAILKLKGGDELEIKLSVKEIFLTTELNNSKKFYAVRILSDNFVNIAAKTDATITKQSPAKNQFNLNNLITEEAAPDMAAPEPENISLDVPPSIPVEEPKERQDDFVLNFPYMDEIEEKEETPTVDLREEDTSFTLSMPEEPQAEASDFKLDFGHDTATREQSSTQNISEELSLDFLKPETTKTEAVSQESEVENAVQMKEEAQDLTLNFLKEDSSVEAEHSSPGLPDTREAATSDFKLRYAKEDDEQEEPNLHFLKTDEAEEPTENPVRETLISEESAPTLDFLKEQTSHEEDSQDNPAKKAQIIAQIKNDIEEIDSLSTSEENENTTEALNSYLFNKNEAKNEKKSFTKTLSSLFAKEQTPSVKDTRENETAVLKKNDKEEKTDFIARDMLQEYRFPTLATLGLEKAEEDDLIAEFVNDTKNNMRLFKDCIDSHDLNQAEYTLIKMQSSASLLNLNDIIHTLDTIKTACNTEQFEDINPLMKNLNNQVHTLESYLESEPA